jgi:hypothetical protein
MPVELLKAIATKPLPLTITDPAEIDKLRVLRAAGHVVAMMPMPGTDQAFARVLHITRKGRYAVAEASSELRGELATG